MIILNVHLLATGAMASLHLIPYTINFIDQLLLLIMFNQKRLKLLKDVFLTPPKTIPIGENSQEEFQLRSFIRRQKIDR